ncbi:ABC transporter permease [Marinovum sp.]|uniref:ABC transporter permease n=1 Tax=Marinovum sp. TaxID=2024839 RepID=UPI002B27697E|nr:ABC transporter permease [Marinovum sp.]
MSDLKSTGPQTMDAPTPEDALHEAKALNAKDDRDASGKLVTADGRSLKSSLNRALRMQKARAMMLIAPLLIFVLVTFIAPIASMLFRSVENDIVANTLPQTTESLASWDANTGELPREAVFQNLFFDLYLAAEAKEHTKLGTRLNYESTGVSSLFRQSGRRLDDIGEAYQDPLEDLNEAWEEGATWFELMSGAGQSSDGVVSNQIRRFNALTTSDLRGDIGFAPSEEIAALLPTTTRAYTAWAVFTVFEDEDVVAAEDPWEAVYAALGVDLKRPGAAERIAAYDGPQAALLQEAAANAELLPDPDFTAAFLEIDEDWGDIDRWETVQVYSPKYTNGYFLNSVDLQKTPDGFEQRPENERIYITLFQRTIFMSLVITGSCILLGYPVAWILANLPARTANLLMILVLLPFWTSLLVRTSAWKVMLQQQGVINDVLVWLGLVADDARLVMINNQFGTIVAMTHILLPFMILPMYSVMQTINPSYLRAAKSLGATNWTAFWRVYFPQSVPGIGAGSILVFILSIGYYITPEIVGGTKGVFISNRIAYHISSSLNWGLAAALGTILFAVVLILYWAYDKIVGIDNVKLG